MDESRHSAYVANAGNAGGTDVVVAFDASTCNATDTSGCGRAGGVLPIGPASDCGDVRVTSRLALGLDLTTNTVYAAQIPCEESATADSVRVFDARHCRSGDLSGCQGPVATVRTGRGPFGLALAPSAGTSYVTSPSMGTLSVLPMLHGS